MQHFPLLHQILNCPGHILHRHFRIDTVLIQQVNMVGAQAFQRTFHCPADMVGTTVDGGRLLLLDAEAEFRPDFHFVAKRCECLADPLFAGVRAIDLRRIEESDAFVVCPANQSDHILFVVLPAVITHHRQAAQTDGRYIQSSEFTILHCVAHIRCIFIRLISRQRERRSFGKHTGNTSRSSGCE